MAVSPVHAGSHGVVFPVIRFSNSTGSGPGTSSDTLNVIGDASGDSIVQTMLSALPLRYCQFLLGVLHERRRLARAEPRLAKKPPGQHRAETEDNLLVWVLRNAAFFHVHQLELARAALERPVSSGESRLMRTRPGILTPFCVDGSGRSAPSPRPDSPRGGRVPGVLMIRPRSSYLLLIWI